MKGKITPQANMTSNTLGILEKTIPARGMGTAAGTACRFPLPLERITISLKLRRRMKTPTSLLP